MRHLEVEVISFLYAIQTLFRNLGEKKVPSLYMSLMDSLINTVESTGYKVGDLEQQVENLQGIVASRDEEIRKLTLRLSDVTVTQDGIIRFHKACESYFGPGRYMATEEQARAIIKDWLSGSKINAIKGLRVCCPARKDESGNQIYLGLAETKGFLEEYKF